MIFRKKGNYYAIWFSVIFVIIALLSVITLYAKSSIEIEREKAKKPMPWDKGSSSIDVSRYPANYKAYYKIFSAKCGQCHTLARPINAPFSGKDWRRYVKRMMRKPGSGISSSQGKKIYLFLKYYVEKKGK